MNYNNEDLMRVLLENNTLLVSNRDDMKHANDGIHENNSYIIAVKESFKTLNDSVSVISARMDGLNEHIESVSNQMAENQSKHEEFCVVLHSKCENLEKKTDAELLYLQKQLSEIKNAIGIGGNNDGSSYTNVSTMSSDNDDIDDEGDQIKEPESSSSFNNSNEETPEDPEVQEEDSESLGFSTGSEVRKYISPDSSSATESMSSDEDEESIDEEEYELEDEEIPFKGAIKAC